MRARHGETDLYIRETEEQDIYENNVDPPCQKKKKNLSSSSTWVLCHRLYIQYVLHMVNIIMFWHTAFSAILIV